MRDRETAELALKASETGHLVLSTLHTVNAGQAIARIVGMFDQEEEKQIRQRLAETIRWIVGQRLVPKVGGGRWAVHDILANTIRSNELIVNGEQEGKTFYDIQDVGDPYLMMTFDQALLRSYEQGIITEETAVAYSTRKSIVQRGIDQIKQKRGQKTSDVEGLRLDIDYNRKLGSDRTMADETQAQFGAQRLALVCENAPERQVVIRAAVEQLGYAMLPPPRPRKRPSGCAASPTTS